MFKQKDSWASQTESCQFDHHFVPLSHICVYKNCEFERIGCIKCQNVLHNHYSRRSSHYLKFEEFQQYIKEVIDNQLLKYKFNEELIKRLKKENQNSKLIQKTLEQLQITQQMLENNFKLAQNRWKPFSDINNQIIQQMIEMDNNHILRQDQLTQILLSQIEQIGLQIYQSQGKQQMLNQKFFIEEQYSKIKKQKFCYSCEDVYVQASPNGAYLAFTCCHKLEIFNIISNKWIVKKKMNLYNNSFSNDSKFYFYYNRKDSIHCFEIKNSQKRIFIHKLIKAQYYINIFPINNEYKKEVVIGSNRDYFTIIRVDNRNTRNFISISDSQRRSFEFDDQNRVVICGTEYKIQFYNYYSSLFLFEQNIQCEKLKLIKATNQLIIGFERSHNLYMINYLKKELYLLNKFVSGSYQSLKTIFNFRYPILMIKSGIIILDEGLNKIQFQGYCDKICIYRGDFILQIIKISTDNIKVSDKLVLAYEN